MVASISAVGCTELLAELTTERFRGPWAMGRAKRPLCSLYKLGMDHCKMNYAHVSEAGKLRIKVQRGVPVNF